MKGPMIVGEASTTVRAAPNEVFDFVLDLERYRQADHKIGRVREFVRNGNTGTTRFSGRIRGLPGPSGTYPYTVTADRLVFGSPIAGAARWFLEFEGSFICEPTVDGTRVTHREAFLFKRPWRWLANPLLRRWLEADTAAEMVRLKELLEGQGADHSPTSTADGWARGRITARPGKTARPRPALSTASQLNIGGMLVAVAGILIQIATGVDYPTIPPGPIILLVAVAIVALGRWRWSPLVGVIVPAFLLVGGTVAGVANDELWDLGEPGQFFGLLVQAVGVVAGLIGGIRALPRTA